MNLPRVADRLNGDLDDTNKVAIEIYKEATGLLISLSLAVVGATGFFLNSSIDWKRKMQGIDLVFGGVAVIASAVSVFFGFISYSYVMFLLSEDIMPKLINIYAQLQHYSFLVALVCFVMFISSVLREFSKTAAKSRVSDECRTT